MTLQDSIFCVTSCFLDWNLLMLLPMGFQECSRRSRKNWYTSIQSVSENSLFTLRTMWVGKGFEQQDLIKAMWGVLPLLPITQQLPDSFFLYHTVYSSKLNVLIFCPCLTKQANWRRRHWIKEMVNYIFHFKLQFQCICVHIERCKEKKNHWLTEKNNRLPALWTLSSNKNRMIRIWVTVGHVCVYLFQGETTHRQCDWVLRLSSSELL